MRKILLLIMILFLNSKILLAFDIINPTNHYESSAKYFLSETLDKGSDKVIDTFYNKKIKELLLDMDKIRTSLESHLKYLERQSKKSPKSKSKIVKMKRKLINLGNVLKKGKVLLRNIDRTGKIKWLKKIPIFFLTFEYLSELSLQEKIDKLNSDYPNLKFLTDKMTFKSEFVDSIVPKIYDYTILGITPIEDIAFDVNDGMPTDSRKRFLSWMATMKKHTDLANSEGADYHTLPLGMRQYIDIIEGVALYLIEKRAGEINAITLAISRNISDESKYEYVMFSDVSNYSWFYTYIDTLVEASIIVGDGKGHFRPNDSITIAESLKIIAKVFFPKGKYKDGVLLQKYGNYFIDNKIIELPNRIKQFIIDNKDDEIQRGELFEIMAKVLIRYRNHSTKDIIHYYSHDDYTKYSAMLKKYNIVNGNFGYMFPFKNITRAEFCKVIYKSSRKLK